MSRAHLTTGISIVIATLVLLSSLHAVQVLGAATAVPSMDGKKDLHDDAQTGKLISELHHHSDKSGAQLIKDGGDHSMYADSRSLRLLHKKESVRARLVARWLRTLHDVHVLHVTKLV
jgi:hypothetical protein